MKKYIIIGICILIITSIYFVFTNNNEIIRGDINDEWWIKIPPKKSIYIKNDIYNTIEILLSTKNNSNSLISYELLSNNKKIIQDIYINSFQNTIIKKNDRIYINNITNETIEIKLAWNEQSNKLPTLKIINLKE